MTDTQAKRYRGTDELSRALLTIQHQTLSSVLAAARSCVPPRPCEWPSSATKRVASLLLPRWGTPNMGASPGMAISTVATTQILGQIPSAANHHTGHWTRAARLRPGSDLTLANAADKPCTLDSGRRPTRVPMQGSGYMPLDSDHHLGSQQSAVSSPSSVMS